ncbi:MAG: metallophosphoesterase family protein [Promethearchaeota archaeon]
MKILHTSDIHLKEYRDDRWRTLEYLLELANSEGVEIFIICGDLFDSRSSCEALRTNLRELFSNNNFQIIILPGNHDRDSYNRNLYYGDNVYIMIDLFDKFDYDNVRIWGFSYEQMEMNEVYNKLNELKSLISDDRVNILLYHGELLDAFYAGLDYGEEMERRYMPCKLSYFEDLGIDYVLAGHFHSKFEIWEIKQGKYFVYPGSPISITKRELGIRKVNLFELGDPPREYPLDTPHFEKIQIFLNPFEDHNPLEQVERSISELHPKAQIILRIGGYLDSNKYGISEAELNKKLDEIIPQNIHEKIYEFRDISHILNDNLFKRFSEKLSRLDCDSQRKDYMKELVIKAMMGLKR